MTIYTDEGGGITDASLKLFKSLKGKLGELAWMHINRCDDNNAPLFSLEVHGYEGTVLLSGCNCGYGGTGPHGSAQILRWIVEENVRKMTIEEAKEFIAQEHQIYNQESVHIAFSEGVKW